MLPIVMGLVFGAIIYLAWQYSQKVKAERFTAWKAFATTRGLVATRNELELRGTVDEVKVVIDTFTESSTRGDNETTSTTYTRVRARAQNPLHLDVKVYAEHAFSGFGKMLGFQDVETGDPHFDRTFVVKASNEDGARALLVDDLRAKLHAFGDSVHLHYDEGEVTVHWQGVETDHRTLGAAVDVVVAAARVEIDDAPPEEAPKPKKKRRRRRKAEAPAEDGDES